MLLDSQLPTRRAKAQKGGPHNPLLAAHSPKDCVCAGFSSATTTMMPADQTQTPISIDRVVTLPKNKSQTAKVCHPPGGRGENTIFQQGQLLSGPITAELGSNPTQNTSARRREAVTTETDSCNVSLLGCVGCTGSNQTYCVCSARVHARTSHVLVYLDPVHPTHPRNVIRYCRKQRGSRALPEGGVFPPHPEHWTPHPTHLGELTRTGGDAACQT